MQGKIVLMTGGTNGFGLTVAEEMLRRGADLTLICRNQARGDETQRHLTSKTGRAPSILIADLTLQTQVKRAAADFRAAHDRLDVLINNAGFSYPPDAQTAEGFDTTFALNYLAYFTLTLELIDLLLAAAPARIINTASEAHRWADIELDNLQGEKAYPPGKFAMSGMYGWTNVHRIMFTYELAERLHGTGVVANTLCPGFVPVGRTQVPWHLNLLMPLMRFMPNARSPRQAAETILYLAADPAAATETGHYYDSGQLNDSAPQTYDAAVRRALWRRTLELTGFDRDPLAAAS